MFSIQHATASLLGGALVVVLTLSGCSKETAPAEPAAGAKNIEQVPPASPPAASTETVTTREPAKGPRLEFRPHGERQDWQPPESTTKYTFELSSGGSEALIIKSVDGAIGCEVTEIRVENAEGGMETYQLGAPIAGGRNIHILTKLYPEEISCSTDTRVMLVSNDPRGTFRIGVSGRIHPYFHAEPRSLDLGRIVQGEAATCETLITSNDSTPFEMKISEQTLPSGLSFELVPVDADGKGKAITWKLTATVAPEMADGGTSLTLALKSDVVIPTPPNQEGGFVQVYEAQVAVTAMIVGDFSSSPAVLSMGLVRSGQGTTRTMRVECNDPNFSLAQNPPTVRITGLPIPGTAEFQEWEHAGCFTTAVHPFPGKNAVEIEVGFEGLPPSARGSFRGSLVIELEHPRRKRIVKVITGVCR
jgi:hypothetical protein